MPANQAIEIMGSKPDDPSTPGEISVGDALRLLHELQVHQAELAQQNEALQEARNESAAGHQRYAALYEAAPVGLVTVDRRGKVLEVNRRGRDLLRPDDGSLIGRSILECVTDASQLALVRALSPLQDLARAAVQISLNGKDGDGTVVLLETRPNPRDEHSVLLALTDITERHRVETELAHARKILELSNRISRTGFWEYDRDHDRLVWSPVTRELLEVDPGFEPTLQASIGFFAPGDGQGRIAAAMAAAIEQGLSYDLELQITTQRGREIWVRAIGIPEMVDGRCRWLYGTLQDIDTRRQAERARLEQARAEAANRAKSAFLARMSHELRTPLNAVLGFAQLLQFDAALRASPVAATQVRHIRTAGEHLLAMIDEVLDLARIESGGLRLNLQPFDVSALVAECVVLTHALGTRHQVDVRVERHDPTLRALGDPVRARQVLFNLLTNAIKYNQPGGSVTIALEAGDEGWVSVAMSDTGRGMDAEQLANLFQPFNRLGVEHSGIEGTGLGLVISRQLVDAMGGTLGVRSEPGRGSVFTVRLRRAQSAEADLVEALTMPAALDGAAARPLVVLYVEDDPASAELVRSVLSLRPGVQVEIAADSVSGLAAAQRLHPDLILLDMDLRPRSGLSVFESLRTDAATGQIPCVAVSANAMGTDIDRALGAGFVDYLTKPINIRQLLALVDRLRA